MNRSQVIIVAGIAVGVGSYFLLKGLGRPKQIGDVHLTSQDFDYQQLSPGELATSHLADLNDALSTELQELGLDQQSVERLIENRPYRSKLELVSRMVLGEETYARIKDKVAVADGREPVKVA